jgi:hypothetical protein
VRETPGNPEAMRVRLADRKIEVVTSLKGLRRVSDNTLQGAYWMGVAPDDSFTHARHGNAGNLRSQPEGPSERPET